MRTFSEIIKDLRQRTGLNQGDLAVAMGEKPNTVSGWKGRKTFVWLESVVKICEERGYDINEVLLGTPGEPSADPARLIEPSQEEKQVLISLAKQIIDVLGEKK